MSDRNKRILYAVIFVIATVALAFAIYWVIFRPAPTPPPVNVNEELPTGALPEVNEGLPPGVVNVNEVPPVVVLPKISTVALGDKTLVDELTTAAVENVDISPDGQTMRYYDPVTGQFYRINADGEIELIADVSFPEVESVAWSPVADEAILEFPDGSNIFYDFETGDQVTLPKEYEEFDFSGNGDQIAFKYMHLDKERRVLGVASPDGSGARTLEALGENDEKVDVNFSPDNTVAATFRDFIDGGRQEIGFIGLANENFKGMIVEGGDFRASWSPDGKQMLYSVYSNASDGKPTLWAVDAKGSDIGKNRIDLGVNTWADKCAFASDGSTAYCGVPKDLRDFAGLTPGVANQTTDDIYQIDLATGAKSLVAIPVDANGNEATNVQSISVSEDGSVLYYVDSKTGRLNKINLK